MKSRPVVIVLAAGEGTRFVAAGHKLAQRVGSSSVLALTLRHALSTHLPVSVVTTEALADTARRYVASRDVVVLPARGTPGAQTPGMGVSIAAGVSARPHASGWLVLPGDMPVVQAATLLAVAAALEHHPVAYAQYRGRRGHPVGFGAELFTELATLTGDEGARRLVARYPAHAVEIDDPGVLIDIDTEADLEQVRIAHAAAKAAVQASR